MESINSIAGAAQKAIWGEQRSAEEPISGEQGAGTVHEPYDKGNEETISKVNGSTQKESNDVPSSGIDTTSNRDGPSNAIGTKESGDPVSGQQPEQKHQGANRPDETPTDDKGKTRMPHSDEEREALMQKGEFPHDPNDHSGEPLHMHDGSEKKEENDVSEGKKDRSASVSQEGGNPMGKKQGTGEEYVKSTGMAADGGDFDVTNPGAGAEATRLLEEKGVHKSVDNKAASNDSVEAASSDGPEKTKTSKMAKLKEKLHIKSH
jgi:hypothetical protein